MKFCKISIRKVILYCVIIVVCLLIIFPVYWMINTSLQREKCLFFFPPYFFPLSFFMGNYIKLIRSSGILLWIKNSFIVSGGTVLVVLIFSSLAGYSFSRFKYKGKTLIMLLFLSTQMIGAPLIIAPIYITFVKIRLADTLLGLIIANVALIMATSTWISKGFFDAIPKEIEEAALLDGCTRFGTFYRIILPLSRSALISICILTYFMTWNDYIFCYTLISDPHKWTGGVGLASLMGEFVFSQGEVQSAALMFSIIPVVLCIILQRYIKVGIVGGAVKG